MNQFYIKIKLHPWAHPAKAYRRMKRNMAINGMNPFTLEIMGVVAENKIERIESVPEVLSVEILRNA